MKPKLIELSEILKQKPEIKERLKYKHKFLDGCFVEVEPAYHDVLEYLEDFYLGDGFLCDINMLDTACNPGIGTHISLSLGTLAEQSDETITQIISLCKNNVPRN